MNAKVTLRIDATCSAKRASWPLKKASPSVPFCLIYLLASCATERHSKEVAAVRSRVSGTVSTCNGSHPATDTRSMSGKRSLA